MKLKNVAITLSADQQELVDGRKDQIQKAAAANAAGSAAHLLKNQTAANQIENTNNSIP